MAAAAAAAAAMLVLFSLLAQMLLGPPWPRGYRGRGCLHLGRCAWHGHWWGTLSFGEKPWPWFCKCGFGTEISDQGKAQGLGEQCPAHILFLRFYLPVKPHLIFLSLELDEENKWRKHHRSTKALVRLWINYFGTQHGVTEIMNSNPIQFEFY